MQLVSDIHLERLTSVPVLDVYAPAVALLGDIGNPFHWSYSVFLAQCSRDFEKVFVLTGNHEYYQLHYTIDETDDQVCRICLSFPNVVFLQCTSTPLNDQVEILGCTLWSKIELHASRVLNDFKTIHIQRSRRELSLMTYTDYLELHKQHTSWLNEAILSCKQNGKRCIILTHHGPMLQCSGKYVKQHTDPNSIHSGFVSDLKYLLQPHVIACCSGHVHSNVDLMIQGVRIVSNCIGYEEEDDVGFRPDLVVKC